MTDRPRPRLTGENLAAEFRHHLDRTLPTFSDHPGVVGVTLNGGVARGFADERSEIDVTLFLTSDSHQVWSRGGSPVPTGITKFDGQLYDVKLVDVDEARERDWSEVELWDLSYAEVLYDPEGVVGALADEKLSERPPPDRAEGYLFEAWWHFRLAGDIWIERGDALQGHFVMNDAVDRLLRATFAANAEYVPHEKWLVHMSRSLQWTPETWDERLQEAMDTRDFSVESLKHRQRTVESLWKEVDEYLVEAYYDGLPVRVMQRTFFEALKTLVQDGTVPRDEWEKTAGLGLLSVDPFHEVAQIEGDRIVLDLDRFLDARPDDLYEWHYEVLDAVRAGVDG